MKPKNIGHLEEKMLLMAIIDEGDLPPSDRHHLSVCPQCGERKKKIEQDFFNLGETAKRFTPVAQRKPILPSEKSRASISIFKIVSFKPVMATALAVILVVAASIWTMESKKMEQMASTGNSGDIWEDEQLMLDMNLLAENALPGEYISMPSDDDVDFEEAFMDFLAPVEDNQPLSLDKIMKGDPLC